jgi:hypothetical protein
MKKIPSKPLWAVGLASMFGLLGGLAQAATPYTSAVAAGALSPGIYGRIEIGTAPPPPLIYTQPVEIYRAPEAVQPLYLHVPPGHAKNWSKHCSKYNACGYPVYFVRVDGDERFERQRYEEYRQNDQRETRQSNGSGRGNGNGNGNGKGRGKSDRDD